MQVNRSKTMEGKTMLTVTNPLGLVLCSIFEDETTYFQTVTKDEQEFIHHIEAIFYNIQESIITE